MHKRGLINDIFDFPRSVASKVGQNKVEWLGFFLSSDYMVMSIQSETDQGTK